MPQTEERNLELKPLIVGTHDRRPNRKIQFELSAIKDRFTNNCKRNFRRNGTCK